MSVTNPPISPTPTSLREQIETLAYNYNIDGIMSLVTTYIEAARIEEIERIRYDSANMSAMSTEEWNKFERRLYDRIASLQAQKAVLEDK